MIHSCSAVERSASVRILWSAKHSSLPGTRQRSKNAGGFRHFNRWPASAKGALRPIGVLCLLLVKRSQRCYLRDYYAALAILQFGPAMFENKTAHQSIDVTIHDTYFVVAKTHLQLLQGAIQRVFCFDILAAAAWILPPAEPYSLGLTHLVVATIGVRSAHGFLIGIDIFGVSIWVVRIPPANHWPLLACFA